MEVRVLSSALSFLSWILLLTERHLVYMNTTTAAGAASPADKNELVRTESDSLGEVKVPADKLWGAQTQRSIEHFSIGKDLIPREMITAYAILKKAAAYANHAGGRLDDQKHTLISAVADE